MPRIPGPKPSRKPKTARAEPSLPLTLVLEVTGRDTDGEFLAKPVKWEGSDPAPRITLAPAQRGDQRPPGIGDRILAKLHKGPDGVIARVIKVLPKPVTRVVGQYTREKGFGTITPADKKSRLTFIVARGDEKGAKDGDLVIAVPADARAAGTNAPKARIVEIIGGIDEPGAISLLAIHAHGIPDSFPMDAIAEAKEAEPPTLKGRTDLRKIPLITIDPDDARDHDDAVHAEPDPAVPGGWIVTVAIADVAAYVTHGSALDREAYLRGNSTYFPDRVAPMLPEELSADLCSLREGENRATMAVRMHFNPEGRKTSHTFIRGLMRSAAKLSYQQVQNAIDGNPDDKTGPLLETIIKPLYAAYAVMKKGRAAREPLEINSLERRVRIGADGKIETITLRQSLSSMQLIEEMMIQANVAAAETLEGKRVPAVYRVHDEPSAEKIDALADFMHSIKMPFTMGQKMAPSVFNCILRELKDGPFAPIVNEVVLRSQSQAIYSADNIGHFGLNLMRYAHFTSPIRRYADLIVHRGLIRALGFGNDGLTDDEMARLPEIAEKISTYERRSMLAERESVDRYLAAYMSDRIGVVLPGRISGVTSFGLFIRLDETGADGLVPIRTIGNEFFRHDEGRHALVGSRSGETYTLGDRVEVKLLEAAPVTGGLRFSIESHAPMHAPSARGDTRPPRPDKPKKGFRNFKGKRPGPAKPPKEKRGGKRR
jgi:ribonuclease R